MCPKMCPTFSVEAMPLTGLPLSRLEALTPRLNASDFSVSAVSSVRRTSRGLPDIVGYTASGLAAGTATPAYTINTSSTATIGALAFDASGDLWASATGANPLLIEYLGSSLTSGPPVVWRSTTLNNAVWSMAFDPHAANLPLNGARALPRTPAVRKK
jgi:hypothetical protein